MIKQVAVTLALVALVVCNGVHAGKLSYKATKYMGDLFKTLKNLEHIAQGENVDTSILKLEEVVNSYRLLFHDDDITELQEVAPRVSSFRKSLQTSYPKFVAKGGEESKKAVDDFLSNLVSDYEYDRSLSVLGGSNAHTLEGTACGELIKTLTCPGDWTNMPINADLFQDAKKEYSEMEDLSIDSNSTSDLDAYKLVDDAIRYLSSVPVSIMSDRGLEGFMGTHQYTKAADRFKEIISTLEYNYHC